MSSRTKGKAPVIKVTTGRKKYTIQSDDGKILAEFSFCPTDTGITRRYSEVLSRFGELHIDDGMDVNRAVEMVEGTIREQFDYLFGFPVSDSFFKDIRPLATMRGGGIFARYVLRAIGEIISSEKEKAESCLQQRIEKFGGDSDAS